jgi:predicted outer membrane protein
MRRRTTLLLAALGAALAGTARAQTRLAPDPTPRLPAQPGQGMAIDDLRSLQRAALFCDAQAVAGQLGAQRAGSPELRQLAEAIGTEHARFRRDIGAVAAEHGLELPDRTAARIQDPSLDALRQASGPGFDRAFLARQLGLYRPMAELFQTMASNSPDPTLQRLGITVLAAVRAHFETARRLGEPLGLRADTVETPPQY